MGAQVVLTVPPPVPSPSQAVSGRLTGSRLYAAFLEFLRPWIERVVDDPRVVEGVAQELLGDVGFLYLLTLVSQDMVLVSEDELRNAYRVVCERFGKFGIDVEDSIEIILEHDLWKLRKIKENFTNFASAYIDFALKSPGDAYRYAIILTALMLLLVASMEVSSREKLEPIANEIKRLADELELYTLAFMIMLKKMKKRTAEKLKELLEERMLASEKEKYIGMIRRLYSISYLPSKPW
jgi:hypothetical protein